MRKLHDLESCTVTGGSVYADTVYTLTDESSKTIFTAGNLLTLTKDTFSVNGAENGDVFSSTGYKLSDSQSIVGVHVGGSTIYTLHDKAA